MTARFAAVMILGISGAFGGELHELARVCKMDAMRAVLARRPALNELDGKGMTALQVAVEARKRGCVALLLEAGADRQVRDRAGRTALEMAERIDDPNERFAQVHMLKNFSLGTPAERRGAAPGSLEHAVMNRQTEVAKMMLELGADVNKVGTGGTTPLADAALKGDVEMIRALVARGAKVQAVSAAGTQAVHDAALGDHAEAIRELVKLGADVNAGTRDEGQTPLHVAAVMGKVKAVEALLALGADGARKDAKGRTALAAAEQAGVSEAVAALRRAALK